MKQGYDQKNPKFDPNTVTFAEGEVRVERALKRAGVDIRAQIVTSKDDSAQKLLKMLTVSNVPAGFTKYQLPIVLDRSQLFISTGQPNAKVDEHSHNDGDGIRFIAAGSIEYNGQTLRAGDWMFIPKGKAYRFTVGPDGATMCYCYCCCCAGAADLRGFLDPGER